MPSSGKMMPTVTLLIPTRNQPGKAHGSRNYLRKRITVHSLHLLSISTVLLEHVLEAGNFEIAREPPFSILHPIPSEKSLLRAGIKIAARETFVLFMSRWHWQIPQSWHFLLQMSAPRLFKVRTICLPTSKETAT